uniref:Uncharacterized protein n=1 Tax=Arundo donax TaxID=35708 RepID=A0A0A9GQ04_ARUDO
MRRDGTTHPVRPSIERRTLSHVLYYSTESSSCHHVYVCIYQSRARVPAYVCV